MNVRQIGLIKRTHGEILAKEATPMQAILRSKTRRFSYSLKIKSESQTELVQLVIGALAGVVLVLVVRVEL